MMSVWVRAMVAANSVVIAPTTVMTASAVDERANRALQRASINTPAVTIVAAWISALTGVGPSMASGSHTCRGSWADLPTAPQNNNRQMSVGALTV